MLKNGLLRRVIPIRTADISARIAEERFPEIREWIRSAFSAFQARDLIKAVFRIRRIRMFFGLVEPLVTSTDPTDQWQEF